MNQGQPIDMPVGVVDLDNTTTTRKLVRNLDAFETTKIVAHYPNLNEARNAIQRNEIYAFIYFPEHTTSDLLAFRQPKISFYYNYTP
jgi:ABC-2 type transport system permease protein